MCVRAVQGRRGLYTRRAGVPGPSGRASRSAQKSALVPLQRGKETGRLVWALSHTAGPRSSSRMELTLACSWGGTATTGGQGQNMAPGGDLPHAEKAGTRGFSKSGWAHRSCSWAAIACLEGRPELQSQSLPGWLTLQISSRALHHAAPHPRPLHTQVCTYSHRGYTD